jgi:hypothetical protein
MHRITRKIHHHIIVYSFFIIFYIVYFVMKILLFHRQKKLCAFQQKTCIHVGCAVNRRKVCLVLLKINLGHLLTKQIHAVLPHFRGKSPTLENNLKYRSLLFKPFLKHVSIYK